MTRYSTHTATATFEVEVLVGGVFIKGSAPTHDDPGEPGSFEDVEVEEFGGLKATWGVFKSAFRYETIDLLEGCNRKSPDIQRFLANVLAFIGEDADAALIQEIAK